MLWACSVGSILEFVRHHPITPVAPAVPLNQGCLAPIKIVIPPGSILHPSPTAAVVGGNVLTSQRVVDVVLKAFGACAASQGCMK